MKKQTNRLLSILLTFVMLLGMLPTTAFATENSHSEHSSYITHIEAVAGNCTTPGNIEFWYCSYYTCDKCYSDEAMTQEISPADVVITPGAHSDACVGCEYGKSEKTFELFVPSEHPYYDEDEYTNNGLHILTPQLKGFTFLFVSEYNGALYAMGNETLADGSRPAINLSEFVGEDGSITVDSDTVEFFTYKEIPYTYTFSPDNGYMTVLDGKIVVHGENLCDIDTAYDVFPQSIRFEQNTELSDYEADKGYLFGWALNSPLILFDDSGAEPKFTPTLMWPVDENGDYIEDENGVNIDNCAHNIMLYMERCEHPNMKHTEAAEVSCTQDGAIEHWYCEDCHLYFADAQGNDYIELPEGESDYKNYLHTSAWGHSYDDDCICENCGNPCLHTNAFYTELEELEPSCFEPGMRGYWFCEDCWRYLDKDQDNAYWEEDLASRIPATGHYFNTDTGVCDECGLANPVYKKVTSLNDVNEEDLYIIVAEVKGEESTEYFVLGGLEENKPDEQGNVWCPTSGKNAIKVAADGSISLVNQDILEDGRPSEFMLDVNPEQFGDMTNLGLTTVMLKLPNYCVYPFQSRSFDYNEYMGVPRYGNGVYGMWDSSDWVIDFYTTEVTDDTYRYEDEFGSKTHAEQVADGNIGENITEGNLLLYKSSFYAVGGAMFTLRLREYNDQYYFICGEDGFLEGVTQEEEYGPIKTNDTQYAVWLYRYDVPTVDTHTCDWGDWVDDKNDKTHTRTCQDETCSKTETETHGWDNGVETKAPTCTETGVKTYTCDDCGATKIESIDALDHDWSKWIDDGVDETTDTHTHTCQRNCGVAAESEPHSWGNWTPDGDTNHKKTCSVCSGTRTATHSWNEGVITTQPTEDAEGVRTYTCSECGHTKTEPVDKLEHVHSWTNWAPNNDGKTHSRSCRCNETETGDCSWDAGVVTKQPTHYEEGIKTYTCSVCSGTKTEAIAKTTNHEWSDWSDNNDGTHTRSCRCNANETKDCTYDSGVVTEQPTHTEKGIKTYTCTVCGHTYTEDIPVLTDHAWGEWMINKLDEANTHIRYCICNESETAPHNFDNGQVTTEATHTSVGVRTFTCTDGCGYSYTEEIPATPDHEWTDWSPNDNETHTRSCRCNANETKPCEWDDGVVTAPTCEEEGATVYTCTVCGNTKTETTPALDHDWGDWTDTGANAPADIHERSCQRDDCDAKETGNHEWGNWTSSGSAEHKKTCSVCKGERTATHAWDNGVVTKEATTKETGAKKYTCADCGATKTEVIPKIVCDHTWGKREAENDETHIHYCENGNGCEAFQRQAHEWNNGVVTTEPTETTEGVMTYTCLVCSHEKTESIAMLEHTHRFGGWTSDGADTHTRKCENGSTCTATETEPHSCDAWENNEDGTHSGKCSVCGAGIVEAHTWGEWVVQNDGSLKRTCTAECGASEELPVLQPITDSVVTTTSDKNDASAELKDDAVVLFNSVLTNEEQTAVAAGNTTVCVYLEVEDIPVNEVSASDKAAAEAVIEEEDNDLDETTKIGMYLDINLFKEVTTTTEETSGSTTTTTTETEASQITETSNKVTITIEIPDDLINDDASVERIYRIIRVHEDENGNVITDVIEGIFDPENKTFTFETDKFSTYALAYNDTEKAVTTYTVTYTDGVDGVVVFADQTFTVEAGEATPTISNPTRSGYTFKGWNPSVAATVTGNVTYTATWQKNSSGGYIPSVPTFTPSVEETVGGDTTVDKKYPEQGDKVTITADPDKGYEVDEVIVTDRNGNKVEVIDNGDGTYSFKQPYGKVTITVTYVPEQVGFVDVEENSYYYDAVNWAVANGITNGTSDTTFSPNASCTRAQMVTFLWRAAGCPEPAATDCKLTDVDMDSYYGKAVLWAIENGITNGTSATTFGPDAACTRAQMAAFLCRMAGGKAVSSTGAFADIKADTYYAEAVQWAVENGVTNGTGDNKFSPDAVCTRGQMVTFLYRYFVK